MAPPNLSTAPKAISVFEPAAQKNQIRTAPQSLDSTQVPAVKESHDDKDLATIFRSDLTSIKTLVTCSICDQLLYEPWTLSCGHTYCYSCLCNWFVPNKRKKSCPECRVRVKQVPAPNYLIKQLVEVFTKRKELMPSDESIEQHAQKRSEEIAEVENDKVGDGGLFKGSFPASARHGSAFRDEEDGVLRCPGCHHEYEGGALCDHCGYELDGELDYELYGDMLDDEADLDDLELDLDGDSGSEPDLNNSPLGHGRRSPAIPFPDYYNPNFRSYHYRHPLPSSYYTELRNRPTLSDASEMESENDEDEAGSLEDFVAGDEEDPTRSPVRRADDVHHREETINITSDDDESDEGGAISNRMPRRRRARFSPTPSAVTGTTNDSDNGDMNSEAGMLRNAGWSPLNQELDSEAEEQYQSHNGNDRGFSDITDSQNDSDDTETMVGNGDSESDESRSRGDYSETPTYSGPPYIPHEHIPGGYENLDGDADDDDSEAGSFSIYDRDGDTEMSSSRSVSVSTDEYDEERASYPDEPRSEHSNSSRMTHGDGSSSYSSEQHGYLGHANLFHDAEDESDDDPRPAIRRNRYGNPRNVQIDQQYDPRISSMFANHQQIVRGVQPPSMATLNGLNEEAHRQNEGRRRMTAYRVQPSRRNDPLRSSRSPSANRVIASSIRNAHAPRQYTFTGRTY